MAANYNDPKVVAEAALSIYNERYKKDYEENYKGQYVAINVLDGSAYLGTSALDAITSARQAKPDGVFHLIRVGHPSTFEVGLALRYANPDRIH